MSAEAKLVAINILKAFNVVGLIVLIFLTFIILNRIAGQAKANHDDTQASTNRIESDLGCLGRFFSQTNRTDLKIQNLNTCTIVNTSTGKTTVLPAGNNLNSNGSNQPAPPTAPQAKTQSSQTTVPQPTSAPAAKPTTTSAPPSPNPQPTNLVQQVYQDVTKPINNLLGGQ